MRNPSIFFIGVSGHQNLGDETTQEFVAQQFREILFTYQKREKQIALYSSLAKGADQLFVRIALEAGISVEAILPCSHYEALYSSKNERSEYTRLLNMCQAQHQLPNDVCSETAFLAAGQWIIDRSHLAVFAWNGLPPQGKGGTGDIASYARLVHRPFVHIDTRLHTVKTYGGEASSHKMADRFVSPKQEFTVATQVMHKGSVFDVEQYRVKMPDEEEVVRDVVKRPESVFILPLGQQETVLLIEEYDFGAGRWQLTLPGGKVDQIHIGLLEEQAQKELREEIGYQAGRLEKLISFYSQPGYITHHVHAFVAYDLLWNPLELEKHEEIHIHTYTLQDALTATAIDDTFDPDVALILWLYAHKKYGFMTQSKR